MGNCLGPRRKSHEAGPSDGVYGGGCIHIPLNIGGHWSPPLRVFPPQIEEEGQPVPLPTPRSEGDILKSPNLRPFTYHELKSATKNFWNLIGEGGFGFVYKGWLNPQTNAATKPGGGTVVAVKKLKPEGFQGHKEWLSEVKYLGQLHHPNLVKLIGYCLDGDKRLLVYEFMAKGSLENHLFRRGEPLSWAIRTKVAIGAARGLSFLHNSEQQVIYRDFKASNILLDLEYNAKLSDFGLAKAGPTGDLTHVTTQVLGTHGYAAPEYIATGRLSSKCDVYSFGVVLLELLSGRRAVDNTKVGVEQNLVDWAKPYLGDRRRVFRIMDIKLEGQYPHKGAFMAASLALECLGDAKHRPSMGEVLARLEKIPVPKDAGNQVSKSDGLQPILIPSPRSPPRRHHRRHQSSASASSSPANGTPTAMSPFAAATSPIATPTSPFPTPVKSLLSKAPHEE